ncbi:mannose-1-phosphate guanylyltransferase [bacterium]|nr:mannose-1-phosphate guanylyltransferase [bacterium]
MVKAVIIAGGRGERFWPKSRIKTPKQLLPIASKKSMLYETVKRIRPLVKSGDILIIARKGLEARIKKELPEVPLENIISEPFGRDTAAAVGLGAILVESKEPESVIIILPADHVIGEPKKFLKTLRVAIKAARDTDNLVTMGIKPTRPETGYGYIEISSPVRQFASSPVYRVKRFAEKPGKKEASKFVKNGRYLWNSGMFIWRASVILEAMKKHMPQLYRGLLEIQKALGTSKEKRTIEKVYKQLDKISIDYGIMEKAKNTLVVKADYLWDDVGNWQALERILVKDKQGNITRGKVCSIGTKNSIILSDKGIVGTIGLKDLIVVSTKDAILICPKDRAQEVKELVHKLGKNPKLKKYI